MTAYADATSLALYLGRDLTAAEAASASAACAAATDYIDRYVGKSWQGVSVSGELQTVYAPTVRLDRAPVASVASVTARSLVVGETPRVLVAGTGYELIDTLNGMLLVNESEGTILTVSYVVGSPAPASIAQAANIIAAQFLVSAPAYSKQVRGIQKLKADSAEITYDPIETALSIPPTAQVLLDAYRPGFSFA